jgi:hypothetical protein
MQLPGAAALPAVDSRRQVLADDTGRRAVELSVEKLRPSEIMTRAALENAAKVNSAVGGSTNAILHLLAIAGRLGVALTLDDIDRIGREIPLMVDLMPSVRFLMEEFSYAGGIPCPRGPMCAEPRRQVGSTGAGRGSQTCNVVPSPGGLCTVIVPPSASTRSVSPVSPEPLAGSAPPMPSSRTVSRRRPSTTSAATHMAVGRACLAAFVSASATT